MHVRVTSFGSRVAVIHVLAFLVLSERRQRFDAGSVFEGPDVCRLAVMCNKSCSLTAGAAKD